MTRTTPIERSGEHQFWHRFERGLCLYCGWYCYDCPNDVATCKCKSKTEVEMEYLAELKAEIVKLLVTKYDCSTDEAERLVEESPKSNPELWHENSVAEDLAKHLASDDEDD